MVTSVTGYRLLRPKQRTSLVATLKEAIRKARNSFFICMPICQAGIVRLSRQPAEVIDLRKIGSMNFGRVWMPHWSVRQVLAANQSVATGADILIFLLR